MNGNVDYNTTYTCYACLPELVLFRFPSDHTYYTVVYVQDRCESSALLYIIKALRTEHPFCHYHPPRIFPFLSLEHPAISLLPLLLRTDC